MIDIENSIKAAQSKGYAQWAKIHNLKQAAKTVNFLTENNILQYADLQAKVEEVTAASEQAGATLKATERRLADCMAALCHVQAGVHQRRRNGLFQGVACLWYPVRDMAAAGVAYPPQL